MKKFKNYLTVSSLIILFCALCFSKESYAAEETNYKEVNDAVELTEMLDIQWEDYFSYTVFDPEEGVWIADDNEENPQRLFSDDNNRIKSIDSIDDANDFFEDTPFKTEELEDGTLEIKAPYQTRRIVIYSDELDEAYGATNIYHYAEYSEYVLEFASQEDTKKAWQVIKRTYPDSSYLDEVLSDIMLDDSSLDKSWGYDIMAFDSLKDQDNPMLKDDVTVAIIDSGTDLNNPYFNRKKFSKFSYDFVNNTNNVTDKSGHGTHIAGIISQCTPDIIDLMALRVFDNNGNTTWLLLNTAMQYAIDHGAGVINMSLGISSRLYLSRHTALDNSLEYAFDMNVPVCCPAGNDGLNISHVYPACSDKTITVSAIDENKRFVKSFDGGGGSGFGDGVSFSAPGIRIISASKNGGLVNKNGTSCSTAFVSSALSILKSKNYDLTIDKLTENAIDITEDLGEEGKDPYYGWGLIKFQTDTSIDIVNAKITEIEDQKYTGYEIRPKPEVLFGGITLEEGIDYTVSYKDNTNVGVAFVLITGKGNYKGNTTASFRIISEDNSTANIKKQKDNSNKLLENITDDSINLYEIREKKHEVNEDKNLDDVVHVSRIKFVKKRFVIKKGKKKKLKIIVLPGNANNKKVTWKTKNSKVAIVSSSGVLKAKKRGVTKVICTSVDGKKRAVCRIKVK